MKIKDGFMLRNVGGENLVVAVGEASDYFHGMIRLNDTAAFLWKKMEDGVDTKDGLVKSLTSEYDVTDERAGKGVDSFLQTLQENQILE